MTAETGNTTPWLAYLPGDWGVGRLDHVADIRFSNVDKKSVDGELPVRLCNYVDVYANDRIQGPIPFMEATADAGEIRRFSIRRGDVLATKDSESPDDIAIPAIVTEDYDRVVCGYHLAMIRRRSSRCEAGFLFWLHAAKTIRAQYEAQAVGVTRFGLSQHAFRSLRVPLPPHESQRKIAEFLDLATASIEGAQRVKSNQVCALDRHVRSEVERLILGVGSKQRRDARRDWVPSVPRDWDVVQVKRLLARMDYGISDPTESVGSVPVLKMGHLQGGEISFKGLDYVSAVDDSLVLERGDILYNRTNSREQVGKAAVFRGWEGGPVTFASYLVRLRLNHRAIPEYLNYVLNSDPFLSAARCVAIPSVAQSNLNSTRYGRLWVPLPPVDVQAAIARTIGQIRETADRVQSLLRTQILELDRVREALIHECVTGKRRVTDEDLNRVRRHAQQFST